MKKVLKWLKYIVFSIPILLYFVLIRQTINPVIEKTLLGIASSNQTVVYSSLNQINSKNYISSELSSSSISKDLIQTEFNGRSSYVVSDPRIIAMKKFLIDYHSPMYPYADVFIIEADKYGLDWRLVASISGVESAFGTIIPTNSNNGWGWKGGPGGNWSMFTTWRQGIETITSGLALGYGTKLTPFQIEPTYCPPCGQNPAHSWANGVTQYMNELNYYLNNLESL